MTFDPVPHEWLIKSLKLAKLSPLIVTAIDTLTKSWATNKHISGQNVSLHQILLSIKMLFSKEMDYRYCCLFSA